MPKSKSRSRKLNSYQKSVRAHRHEIAALAEKKGIKFMAAAAMVIKGRKSRSKKSRSKKSKSKSRVSCPRGKVWRKAHKSASGKRVSGKCVKKGGLKKSKSRSRSRSRSM
jgi:hypothetical protein